MKSPPLKKMKAQPEVAAAAEPAPSADPTPKAAKAAGKKPAQPPKQRKAAELLVAGCRSDEAPAEVGRTNLDVLTGQPHADDEVLYVLPMFAPYCSLGGYTHRMKVAPGTSKKSQAVKRAFETFGEVLERATWRQMLQAVPDNDTMSLLCGPCKLSMAGMQKVQKKLDQKKKKEKAAEPPK